MKEAIRVKDLAKTFKAKITTGKILKDMFYPDRTVVDAVKDISFTINEGESVAFLGPNGAGKTTTMKMLSGLLFPTSGKVTVLGFTPFDRKREFLSQISLVMGNKAGLNWDLTPEQSFELLRHIYRVDIKIFNERVEYLTELLDVSQQMNVQVRKLSLGQRMKFELISSILHGPKILFLDEPTIGLDVVAKQKVRSFLRQVRKDFNTTILLTSHDMDDIERVSERVLIIDRGQIILDDPIETLLEKYQQERFVRVIFKNKRFEVLKEYQITQKDEHSITYNVKRHEMPVLISKVANYKNLHDIDIISTPLEEIISDIFQNGDHNSK